MRRRLRQGMIPLWGVIAALAMPTLASAQALGEPDTGQPGDAMIQASLARQAKALDAQYTEDTALTAEQWNERRPQYLREYLHMLGLDPLPERTPLKATITGTLERDGYFVDRLHYQSSPGLYVTANLYRPAQVKPGERLPAVLYVCGHSDMGPNGNKANYQAHGIWLAKHGYICLTVDTLQLGEIRAKDGHSLHHGTYREKRPWWVSAGYTSAGVECWNGIRGIDYLVSRPDVDPERLAVTGISGGGAATYWIAAADERVKVSAAVSGMADLESYVGNRVVNGHCDCMFMYNAYQWPWTRIAGLIAPRPLLFVNSDDDRIFPMDANDRITNRLERFYSRFGAGDRFDTLVSVGGHAYREDIRRGVYQFLNIHLKGDGRPVTDSEEDIVLGDKRSERTFPIPPDQLRVFASPAELPADEINTTLDEKFVPRAVVPAPEPAGAAAWRADLVARLKDLTFRALPDRIPAAHAVDGSEDEIVRLETEPGITVPLRRVAGTGQSGRIVLQVGEVDGRFNTDAAHVFRLDPRGIGVMAWTRKNPPNYVERSYPLLGQTADGGRVRDVAAVARYLKARHKDATITVVGDSALGLVGAYAAVLEPEIDRVIAIAPPTTHAIAEAPALLNVLRVLDVPQALALLAPRHLTLIDADPALAKTVADLYERQGESGKLDVR